MEVTFCQCPEGPHIKNCELGIRLKIKYSKPIEKMWGIIGAEETENFIDIIMDIIKNNKC